MPVTIQRNFGPLDELPLTTRELMREVGLMARETIRRRTATGRDVQGQAFAAYSAGYAKRKQAETGSARVNLELSGGMLNAMTLAEVTDDSVTLAFSS